MHSWIYTIYYIIVTNTGSPSPIIFTLNTAIISITLHVSSTNSEILEKTQHFALKMCSHKWDNDYSSLLSTFNLPTLSIRRSISKLCLLYKITNNLLYFPSDMFIRKPLPSYASRHFDPLTFTIPFSHSSASQNSFVPSVLSLWNPLPSHVKSSSSLITFKS